MKRIPVDRRRRIKEAIEEVAAMGNPLDHANVKTMAGEWKGCMRLRVGRYRAIFCIPEGQENELLEVLQVGPRGDIY